MSDMKSNISKMKIFLGKKRESLYSDTSENINIVNQMFDEYDSFVLNFYNQKNNSNQIEGQDDLIKSLTFRQNVHNKSYIYLYNKMKEFIFKGAEPNKQKEIKFKDGKKCIGLVI